MNRYKLSLIHFIIALLAFMFGGNLHGQVKPEMIPYRLIPADYHPDSLLEIEIEIIQPYAIDNLVRVHREEVLEIIYQRIEFEILNPQSHNQIFKIDGKLYYLIRIPYTGVSW